MASSTEVDSSPQQRPRRSSGGSMFLTQYFMVILFLFGALSLLLNHFHADSGGKKISIVENVLSDSVASMKDKKQQDQEEESRVKQEEEMKVDKKDGLNSRLAGLKCDAFGGPSEEIAKEMVYWEDIPSDNRYLSPFKKKDTPQYLTFDPDGGGWNNIRMAMETVLGMAVAMGRTLVLPPEQKMYLISNENGKGQRTHFSFSHFFPLEYVAHEHPGVEIITMKEFLEREAMTGHLLDKDGKPSFPPGNTTDFDGSPDIKLLRHWLRTVTHVTIWDPEECMAAFPASSDPKDLQALTDMKESVDKNGGFPTFEAYIGKPNPVDAPTIERMKENWAGRKNLCLYDEEMQKSMVVHFPHDHKLGARLLVHFYAFLFFQDWREDLWMKRFVRDHMRYLDEIQCAAARVVHAIRERSRARGDPKGDFDSFHIRRGDFQYTVTRAEAPQIYNISKKELAPNGTVYIATDERDRSFFNPLKAHYDVVFLDDFLEALQGVNTNYYGMIDQLVASRGRVFFGCWFSTFTGYINRIRGYHANRLKAPGYEQGVVRSWYYSLEDRYDHMQVFYPVKRSYHAREFPASWRLIDQGIGELDNIRQSV